jgi:hypothetical protein
MPKKRTEPLDSQEWAGFSKPRQRRGSSEVAIRRATRRGAGNTEERGSMLKWLDQNPSGTREDWQRLEAVKRYEEGAFSGRRPRWMK